MLTIFQPSFDPTFTFDFQFEPVDFDAVLDDIVTPLTPAANSFVPKTIAEEEEFEEPAALLNEPQVSQPVVHSVAQVEPRDSSGYSNSTPLVSRNPAQSAAPAPVRQPQLPPPPTVNTADRKSLTNSYSQPSLVVSSISANFPPSSGGNSSNVPSSSNSVKPGNPRRYPTVSDIYKTAPESSWGIGGARGSGGGRESGSGSESSRSNSGNSSDIEVNSTTFNVTEVCDYLLNF